MDETKIFINKINFFRKSMDKSKENLICPVYLSAKGFLEDVEKYLFDNGVFTADMDTWEE